jgi:hypothetical protein
MQTREPAGTIERREHEDWLSGHDYNFEHFRTRHLLLDADGTLTTRGIAPGERAPDFELPAVGGGAIRWSDLRGRPILLHFGSAT